MHRYPLVVIISRQQVGTWVDAHNTRYAVYLWNIRTWAARQ